MEQAWTRLREEPFRLGEFCVVPQRNRILRGSDEAVLQPKVMDVLCVLAERHGTVVGRAALIDRVWGREFGADESLTKAVSQLRKAFGEESRAAEIIETIPKRGYRLLVAPTAENPPENAPSRVPQVWRGRFASGIVLLAALASSTFLALHPSSEPLSARSERTGIVVTVEPVTSDELALPAGGFADDLSAALARSPLVRARTAGTPEQTGPGLLQYRLRARMHRIGSRMQINAQLLDAASSEVLWGENFDWPHDAQFSARPAAVSAIVREVRLSLLRSAKARLASKPPLTLVPWELSLLVTWIPGDEFRPTEPPHEDSFWLQRRALERDPDFAPAHALHAQLAAYHALFDPPSDTPGARESAKRHAERALEIAAYDAELLYQIALYHRFSGDRDQAEAMLKRVLELDPGHPLAQIDLEFVRGQCTAVSDNAIANLEAELARLPASSPIRWVALSHLSSIHLGRGDFERARASALASRRIIPMTWTAITLAAADVALGRDAEAAQVIAAHRREWARMDLDYFARHIATRWCLGGGGAAQTQAAFQRLGAAIGPQQK